MIQKIPGNNDNLESVVFVGFLPDPAPEIVQINKTCAHNFQNSKIHITSKNELTLFVATCMSSAND
jgi:hypothetical protein